jgi:protein arginine kinase
MDWAELARRAPPWIVPPASSGFPFAVRTSFFAYRSFAGEPFPISASAEALAAIAAKSAGPLSRWGAPETHRLSECPLPVLRMLRERGLIADPSLPLRARKRFKLLALPAAPAVARWAWVNEVEHLTFAQVFPGLLSEADFPSAFFPPPEDLSHLPWAWSPRHGYLASDPSRIGPGLAMELIAHLPALALTRRLGLARNAMIALGIAFLPVTRMERGEMESALFRFRCAGTLGLSPAEAYRTFSRSVQSVLRWEAETQKKLLAKHPKRLEEKVEESFHFLLSAKALPYADFLASSSWMRLGGYLGALDPQFLPLLEELCIAAQTGHLEVSGNGVSAKEEEDITRANVVRLTLERVRVG